MTVADKLVYLSDTKNILADAINSYTQVITPDTPFREYAQWIDNIVFSAEGGIPSLFEGEAGFAWGGLPYYQNPAGTTVASWGNPVGLIRDDSGNGADFTQPTVTARPVLGRVPVGGRRNLLTWTEDFTNSSWIKNNSPALEQREELGVLFWKVIASSGFSAGVENAGSQIRSQFSVASGTTYTISVMAMADEFSEAVVMLDAGGGQTSATFDLIAGTTSAPSISTITSFGGGIWKLSITKTATASASTTVRFGAVGAGDGESGILYAKPQFESSAFYTDYQKVNTPYDINESGVESVHYLHLDGIDDSIATTLPAITNGTLVLAGTNGIWIDDDFNHAGGAFTVGPTTYTGGPVGILPIVGDLIVGGSFAIDRQLTAQERNRVISKLESMGAGEVLV